MNKFLYISPILLLLFLSIDHCQAQKLDGGIYAGLHASQVTGDEMGGYNKFGLSAGAFVMIPFNRKSGLQMEVSYIQKGSRERVDEENPNPYPYYIITDYMEVPFLYYYKSKPFILEGGLTAGILVNGEDGDNSANLFNVPFNPFEFGAILGISYAISDQLRIKWRINNSILPMRGEASGRYRWRQGQYHSGLSFTLNYHFND